MEKEVILCIQYREKIDLLFFQGERINSNAEYFRLLCPFILRQTRNAPKLPTIIVTHRLKQKTGTECHCMMHTKSNQTEDLSC